ncbi:hypothetical protein SLEP1_g28464 [Rubroshorea leprosula]|uniref:Glycosyltransferase n=1 Tax=Rubroshorea leprosula TaxID=152421 RepID=A0AAV5JTX0_9ROSI|nr:hypothetical protein SLEP1_g28464 [Rubroshorea leprosula]
MAQPHNILVVAFPAQGHINPALQVAKLLMNQGVRVTFMTSISAINRMNRSSPVKGLSYAGFSDGNDDGSKPEHDINNYIYEVERCGSSTLREFLAARNKNGTQFTHIVYSLILPWVAVVGREFYIPSTFHWNQPASILALYYHYMKDYGDVIKKGIEDPSFVIELPGLPPLKSHDLPSFFMPSDPNYAVVPTMRRQIELLDQETNPKVLVNVFDALESEVLQAIKEYNMVGIGPLVPSAFLDGKDPSDTSFGGDLFKGTRDYIHWLNSKPENSVIYVSFGSLAVLAKSQTEEIARGLLATGFPFLWVMREGGEREKEEKLSCKEELEKQGMIVPWCSQVEILSHPSVGCFLTHCGWNSTIESLVSGVPIVAFPQWSDQGTNSKLAQDVWKTGVRVIKNEEGTVESHEIKRCLELVMGNEEMRRSAKKWKDLAREAAMEGGSSYKNIKVFVDELGKTSLRS